MNAITRDIFISDSSQGNGAGSAVNAFALFNHFSGDCCEQI